MHSLLPVEALHLVETKVPGHEGLVVLLNVFLEPGQNFAQRVEFALLNGLDYIPPIRSVKEETPSSSSAFFLKHHLQLVEERLLKMVWSD